MKCAECGFYSDIHGCIHKDKPHWGLCGDMDACPQFEKRCEKRSGGSRGCGCGDKEKDKGDCGGGCGSGGGCQDTGCGSGKKCSCDGEDCYDCDTALLPPWVNPFFQALVRREDETLREFGIRLLSKSYADVHGTYADDSLRFKEVHFDDPEKEERDRCRARLIAEDHLHDFSFGDYLYVGVL